MLSQALTGIRILDFTRLFPGPLCTLMLADLGADVIKVEPPEGDAARFFGPTAASIGQAFEQLNRGKRSIVLNLKISQDLEIAKRLANQTNVIVESFRPNVMQRYGLGYENFPEKIYCSITGYGP